MNCTRRTCWVDKVRQVGLRPPPGLSGAPVASEALGRWEGSPLDGSTAPSRDEMDGSEPLSWTAVSTRGWHQQAARPGTRPGRRDLRRLACFVATYASCVRHWCAHRGAFCSRLRPRLPSASDGRIGRRMTAAVKSSPLSRHFGAPKISRPDARAAGPRCASRHSYRWARPATPPGGLDIDCVAPSRRRAPPGQTGPPTTRLLGRPRAARLATGAFPAALGRPAVGGVPQYATGEPLLASRYNGRD